MIVMGNLEGVVGVTIGAPEMWTTHQTFRSQTPTRFTEDGSRVLVSAGDHSNHEWWSWSFGARPEGIRVLPPM